MIKRALVRSFNTSCIMQNLKMLMGDMSVSELARQVGIPQQTLSRYLLFQREITLSNLCKIADFFNEDIDYLIGRKD